MKCHRKKLPHIYCPVIIITVLLFLIPASSTAEEYWHTHALRLSWGEVDNPATINSRESYNKTKLGSDDEVGAAFVMVINPSFDVDIAIAQTRASGTQQNVDYPGVFIDIGLNIRKMMITGKWRIASQKCFIVPWAGAGLHGGALEISEQESIPTSQGYFKSKVFKTTSSFAGIHIVCGADFYPLKSSALAITIEGRYSLSMINEPFDGNIDGAAFLAGIKWDFWPVTF